MLLLTFFSFAFRCVFVQAIFFRLRRLIYFWDLCTSTTPSCPFVCLCASFFLRFSNDYILCSSFIWIFFAPGLLLLRHYLAYVHNFSQNFLVCHCHFANACQTYPITSASSSCFDACGFFTFFR